MSTAVLIVNVVLAAFVFLSVVGSLAWSITAGHVPGPGQLRARLARHNAPAVDDPGYAVDQQLAIG